MPAKVLILFGICKYLPNFFLLFCFYKTSTYPLLSLYQTSLLVLPWVIGSFRHEKSLLSMRKEPPFNAKEASFRCIPTLGIICSQRGNPYSGGTMC